MPKVTEKKRGAAKAKRPRRKSRKAEEEGHSDPQDTQDTQDTQSDPAVSDAESTTSLAGISEEQEEQIAQFFEDRPFFYDKGDAKYKNSKAKDAELFAFSKVVGVEREYQFIFSTHLFSDIIVSISGQVVLTRIAQHTFIAMKNQVNLYSTFH